MKEYENEYTNKKDIFIYTPSCECACVLTFNTFILSFLSLFQSS